MGGFLRYEQLTSEQKNIFDDVMSWYNREWDKIDLENRNIEEDFYSIFGKAGTGKSTLIQTLYSYMGGNIKFVAYTGKATEVLRKKNLPVTTIHKLIYYLREKEKTDDGREQLHFEVREALEELNRLDLLIIDEFSMVNQKMFEDIKDLYVRVLAVGDPNQLPPVGYNFEGDRKEDNEIVKKRKPSMEMSTIVRQAKGNPIIQISNNILENIPPNKTQYRVDGDLKVSVKEIDFKKDNIPEKILDKSNQIIVGRNNRRREINKRMRKYKGFSGVIPQKGDKVVCCHNNWDLMCKGSVYGNTRYHDVNLVNGMIGTCLGVREVNEDLGYFRMDFQPEYLDTGYFFNILVSMSIFRNKGNDVCRIQGEMLNQFDFGYSITSHKSQGSQWEKVIVYNKPFYKWSSKEWKRWLYTAVTRAEDQLLIVKDKKSRWW